MAHSISRLGSGLVHFRSQYVPEFSSLALAVRLKSGRQQGRQSQIPKLSAQLAPTITCPPGGKQRDSAPPGSTLAAPPWSRRPGPTIASGTSAANSVEYLCMYSAPEYGVCHARSIPKAYICLRFCLACALVGCGSGRPSATGDVKVSRSSPNSGHLDLRSALQRF
jgi:hypothetical protein